MAVIGIGVERGVADQGDLREFRFQDAGGAADQVFRVERLAGFGVF